MLQGIIAIGEGESEVCEGREEEAEVCKTHDTCSSGIVTRVVVGMGRWTWISGDIAL
jgi:hypothetical protein